MFLRIVGYVLLAALVVAVISNPGLLGHWLTQAITALKSVGDSIAQVGG
jgi:hypothetical protein